MRLYEPPVSHLKITKDSGFRRVLSDADYDLEPAKEMTESLSVVAGRKIQLDDANKAIRDKALKHRTLLKPTSPIRNRQRRESRSKGDTPLHRAIYLSDVELAKELIRTGADLNAKSSDGNSLLNTAIHLEKNEIAKELIKAGADLNADSPRSESLLAIVIRLGQFEVLKELINAGFDVNSKSLNAVTPLMMAIRSRQIDFVNELIRAGADIHMESWNMNPLSAAVEKKFVEAVEALIAAGVDVNLIPKGVPIKFGLSENDMTSIASIIRKNDMSKLEGLVSRMYGSDTIKKSINNILFIAAGIGSLECCQFLLDVKFPASALSVHNSILKILPSIHCRKNCISPLEIAMHCNKPEHVRLLLKYSNNIIIEKCQTMSMELEEIVMVELRERLSQKYSPKAHVVAGYEDGSPVLIVYSNTENHGIKSFAGKTVKLINPMHVNRQYSLSEAYYSETSPQLSKNDMTIARLIIKERSEELWETHSNLNIISMSATKFVQRKKKVCACITLYCTSKGIIPLGESRFPTTLFSRDWSLQLPVDVREGYFDLCPSYTTSGASTFHEKLKMGCSISKHLDPSTGSGTIGPFVDINGQTGFLTCSHVLFDISSGQVNYNDPTVSGIGVVQPAVGSFMMNDLRGEAFRSASHTPCGYVKRAIFNPLQETSIDAALVMVTNPNRLPQAGHFAVDSEENYIHTGFGDLPTFNTGKSTNLEDVSTVHQVIKCGKKTHLTRGLPVATGVQVRPLSFNLGLPSMTRTFTMKNQIMVGSITGHCVFFQPGDSGSAVFTVKKDRTLECIGMAIGVTSDHMTVVTPIKSILKALGPNTKLKEF